MADTRSAGARILAAQANLCNQLAAELAEARQAKASAQTLADLEAQAGLVELDANLHRLG